MLTWRPTVHTAASFLAWQTTWHTAVSCELQRAEVNTSLSLGLCMPQLSQAVPIATAIARRVLAWDEPRVYARVLGLL